MSILPFDFGCPLGSLPFAFWFLPFAFYFMLWGWGGEGDFRTALLLRYCASPSSALKAQNRLEVETFTTIGEKLDALFNKTPFSLPDPC